MAGKRTTMGYVAWYDQVSTVDSSMVKILRDAGGIMILPFKLIRYSFMVVMHLLEF